MRSTRAFTRISRAAAVLLALAALSLAVGSPGIARAQEAQEGGERPSEIPYDTPGEVPLLSPEYRKTEHEVVLLTDDRLSPRRVVLEKGQLVAWISYSRAPSRVVFERDVAKSMICHSLVNFYIEDDEIRSGELHAGEFASFCELKPGRYRYKVMRQPEEGARAAARQLEGVIVVKDEEDEEDGEDGEDGEEEES